MSIGPNHSFQYPRHSSPRSLSKRTVCARHHSPQRASLHGNIMEYIGEHLFGGWNPLTSLIGIPVCYQPLKPSSITASLCMKSFQGNVSSVPSAVWYNFSESDKNWQCPKNYDLQTVLIVLCAFGNFRDFQFWDTSNTVLFCVCTIRMDRFHYGTGMVHLLSKSHPSANRRWCRSAMHSWRNARHIHEAAYTLASNCFKHLQAVWLLLVGWVSVGIPDKQSSLRFIMFIPRIPKPKPKPKPILNHCLIVSLSNKFGSWNHRLTTPCSSCRTQMWTNKLGTWNCNEKPAIVF